MHVGHGRTNLHWRPHFAHKTFSRQILKFKQRTNVPYSYHHTKGVPYQRSVPVPLQKKRTVLLGKNWGVLTVPTYRTVLPSLVTGEWIISCMQMKDAVLPRASRVPKNFLIFVVTMQMVMILLLTILKPKTMMFKGELRPREAIYHKIHHKILRLLQKNELATFYSFDEIRKKTAWTASLMT